LRSSDTKPRERLLFSPLEDEPAIENLPEPIPLTPEQIVAQSEADERDRQRQREWALVVQALNDNSLAVVRAMRRFRNEAEQEQVERVLTSYQDGSFLIDRLGAGLVVDQDLAISLAETVEGRAARKLAKWQANREKWGKADNRDNGDLGC